MKYIIFERPSGDVFPIVFPQMIDHSFIAQSIDARFPGIKPISAGYCSRAGDCYGESITLKLSSQDEDSVWIKQLFNN